jgi:hypothetical protein
MFALSISFVASSPPTLAMASSAASAPMMIAARVRKSSTALCSALS